MNFDLTKKTAVVSGSTSGIGLAIAQALAKLGATCILIARNEQKLQEKITSLDTQFGQKHRYEVADFNDINQVKKAATSIASREDIHILINNTGGPAAGPIVTAQVDDFLSAYQQHLLCNHILVQAFVEGMKRNQYGRVVNVVSTSVKIPLSGLGVSNTTRGAVASWAKTLANELAGFGITVNNVLPGATSTGRLEQIINNKAEKAGSDVDTISKEMSSEIPMKRFGKPEEIAAVAAFLCTPAAAYVTGTSIPVDGGRTGSI